MVTKTNASHLPTTAECLACGSACCRYIIIDLPVDPRSEKGFEEFLWYLFNPHTKLLKEGRQWSLLVMGRCRMLGDEGKCRIYANRPFICREYPEATGEECHGPDLRAFSGTVFSTPEELLGYLAATRGYRWAKRRLTQLSTVPAPAAWLRQKTT